MVLTVSGRVGLVDEGSTFCSAAIRMMSGAWPPPGAFGVIGVDRAAGDGRDGVVHISRLVDRVGVNCDLNIVAVGHGQAIVDSRRRGSPILVELETAGAGGDLFFQRHGARSVAFAQEAEVHRESFHGLEHARDIPFAGRAGGRIGSGGRSRAAPDHGRGSIERAS